ncbi:MAG: hypothetical protein LLG06_05695 [Desulfobacteraceae bacterium]|nr:hypothetical protein [Desulfobacteraceae bacterium]
MLGFIIGTFMGIFVGFIILDVLASPGHRACPAKTRPVAMELGHMPRTAPVMCTSSSGRM